MKLPKILTLPAALLWRIRKHSILLIGIVIFSLLNIAWNYGSDYYTGKWLGFGVGLIFLANAAIFEQYGAAIASLISLATVSTLWVLLDTKSRYASVVPYDLQALRFFSVESALKLYMVLLPCLVFRINAASLRKYGGFLACAFIFISIGESYWEAMFSGCSIVNSCGGALSNPSLNAGMLAVCLPFIFLYFSNPYRWLILLGVMGAVFLGKANSGIFLVSAFLLMHLAQTKNWRILAALPMVAFCGWYFLGPKFMISGDRIPMWQFFMRMWVINPNHWVFGAGFGTFGVFSINLQKAFQMREGMWWLWMHNDWLQGLFELGGVGLALMLWTYTAALHGLFTKKLFPELQALILYGLLMLVNFPLHISLCCVFLAWLLVLALKRDSFPHLPHNEN